MKFAGSNQKVKQGDGTSKTRPIIEAIYLAGHDADSNTSEAERNVRSIATQAQKAGKSGKVLSMPPSSVELP